MWANVQSSILQANDNPIGAVNAGMDTVLGPSFDYLQTIQSPAQKGVSSDGSFDQVSTNIGAVSGYVNNLVVGPKVGNQLFRDTGGYCKAPGGSIVKRSTYINNYLGGDDAAGILGPSFQRAVQGTGMDGIIPGIGGNLASMNPLKIMNGLVSDGIPPCEAYTCPVVDTNGGINTSDTQFLTPSLELNMGLPPPNPGCRRAGNQAKFEGPAAKVVADETARAAKLRETTTRTEKFADYYPDNYYRSVVGVTIQEPDALSYALWGVALACVVAYFVVK
jgi:hypothetical protein